MFKPARETFSVEIDRVASELQPTTLHVSPLSTLPIGLAVRMLCSLVEKDGLSLIVRIHETSIKSLVIVILIQVVRETAG